MTAVAAVANRQLVGGCGFWDDDATWASTELISITRKAQLDAIATAGITPTRILDLGGPLDARELCVRGTELVAARGGAKTWIYATGRTGSGTCVRSGTGLTSRGEPVMSLTSQAPLP